LFCSAFVFMADKKEIFLPISDKKVLHHYYPQIGQLFWYHTLIWALVIAFFFSLVIITLRDESGVYWNNWEFIVVIAIVIRLIIMTPLRYELLDDRIRIVRLCYFFPRVILYKEIDEIYTDDKFCPNFDLFCIPMVTTTRDLICLAIRKKSRELNLDKEGSSEPNFINIYLSPRTSKIAEMATNLHNLFLQSRAGDKTLKV